MKLLLDTCAFLWLTAAPKRLGTRLAGVLARPDTRLLLSDASVWELCLKWRAGKIALPQPPRQWVESQRQVWRVEAVPMDRTHLYRVTELPEHHKDPFDRLLIAQAIEEGLTLATPDPEIRRYPVATLW